MAVDNHTSDFPIPSFYFKVTIGGDQFSFQEVSGLTAEMEYEQEPRDGGDSTRQHPTFKRVKHGSVTLKKGMIKGNVLAMTVLKDIFQVDLTSDPDATSIQYQTVIITLMNEKDENVLMVTLLEAYPTKWELSSLNAMANDYSIETLQLSYTSMRMTAL